MKSAASLFLGMVLSISCLSCTCTENGNYKGSKQLEAGISNPLFSQGSSPCLSFINGKYYYCQSSYVRVSLRCAESLDSIKTAEEHSIFYSGKDHLISAPRLYRFNNVWYIYYGSDDGDLSSRTIHVLENTSEDPLSGKWQHKVVLKTDIKKSLHPSILNKNGELYLLFSGNPADNPLLSTWSIYAAKLENPWKLASKPSRILTPEYEWECQWATGDSEQDTTPTYLEEAPIAIYSADKSKILLYFAASSTLSQFYCEGMAFCNADDDIMNPSVWKKLSEPVFITNNDTNLYGAGHISFVQVPESDELYFVFHAYEGDPVTDRVYRSPRIQKAHWGENGIPVLGSPQSTDIPVPVPTWEKSR